MRASWEAAARNWIEWAREEDHDHFFWRLNRPAILAELPAPGRLTVDVGCGEGRLSRELAERGHTVVGIEGSETLAAAAREAAPDVEVHVADAAAMPLLNACADLAVASMSLLNVDDMPGAVADIARVLQPGGRLVFTVPHPMRSAKPLGDDPRAGEYFATYRYEETRERDGRTMTYHDAHRPLGAYFAALETAGLLTEALREPTPDAAHVAAHPGVAAWTRQPVLLLVRAVKPGGAAGPTP